MAGKVRWAVLGTGAIGGTFARNLAKSETGELAAVGSRALASARKFAAEYGPNVRAHGSYDDLLADGDVDAVYIATPHPLHAQWAIRAAEAGKHILCEKPVAINHPEAMAMLDAAQRHGVFFMEAFMYRCHPQTAKLVELLGSGVIGRVAVIRATFSFNGGFNPEGRLFKNDLAGGGIMDVGCYPVSMARLVAGAAVGKPFADPIDVSGAGHLLETGVDGWAVASLGFEQGIVAQLSTGIQLAQDNAAIIFGTLGRLVLSDPWTADRKDGKPRTIEVHRPGKEVERIAIDAAETAYTYEADVAGRAILAGRTQAPSPAMTWDDTLGNIQTLDRWRAAIGLTYAMEKPEHPRQQQPLHGRPLRHPAEPAIPAGAIEGLGKPMSRLVMGVDNQPNIAHANAMFDSFFEQGGNAFDTGYIYSGGRMETLLGQWTRSRGVREQVVLITKGAHTPHCYPDALTRQLLESLDRFGLDGVDIYMMHRDNPEVPVGEFVDVMNEHCKAGRFKVFGGSNWSLQRVDEANAYAKKKGLQGFGVVSNNFSLARMVDPVWHGCIASSEPAARQWHVEHQVPLLPWSSQARGFFTPRADVPAEQQSDREIVRCWYSEDNFARRRRAQELAKKYDVLPINIALAYVLCQPFPTFPLIGPRVLEELRTSLPGLGVTLSEDELAYLNLETELVAS